MATLNDFNLKVLSRVPDVDSIMDTTKRDEAVQAGVDIYSRHRSREIAVDVMGAGTHEVALPAEWVNDFSRIQSIEFPVGEARPCLLENDEYEIYTKPSGDVLKLYRVSPNVTDTLRLKITVFHDVNADSSTIPAQHENAVADLAAGVLCEWLSAHFSSSTDSTLRVDSADHLDQGAQFAMRAKRFRTLGLAALGVSAGKSGTDEAGATAKPASGVRSHGISTIHGLNRLTHQSFGRLTH